VRPKESLTSSPKGDVKVVNPYHTVEGRKWMANRVGMGGTAFLLTASFGLNIYFTTVVKEQYEVRTPDQEQITVTQRLSMAADNEAPEGMKVPEEIIKKFAINQDRAGIDDINMDRMEVFMTDLLDPVGFGCSITSQGGVVGVPIHQTWTSSDQVDLENIRIKPIFNKWFQGYQIPSDADPEDLENLKKNFVLSEDAINFYLAKNMHIAGSLQAIVATIIPCSVWLFNYAQAINVNDILQLFNKSRSVRFAIQGLLGLGSFIIFVGMKNMCENYFKKDAIDKVIRTPKEAEAAIEFYTKALERNKLLRKVLGSEGEYYFQEDGEVKGTGFEIPELVGTATYLKYAREHLAKKLAEKANNID